ncbi:copper transporter 4-like [Lycium ferocissimum]|uniref:copper transporter 4-like n=1 Tax=Lycium ferocissimum TaxID=112874 RepID=UPI002815AB0E|nr:copper transporter 4-like [Lycium ferocissimum]
MSNYSVSPSSLLSFLLIDPNSSKETFQSPSYWKSYVMRLFPGSPDFEAQMDYCFSLCLIFLLAFMSEFCSLYSLTMKKLEERSYQSVLLDAGFHGLRMFMSYLVIISVITTDFRFFLVAVSGHAMGNFVCKIYQYHNDHPMNSESCTI